MSYYTRVLKTPQGTWYTCRPFDGAIWWSSLDMEENAERFRAIASNKVFSFFPFSFSFRLRERILDILLFTSSSRQCYEQRVVTVNTAKHLLDSCYPRVTMTAQLATNYILSYGDIAMHYIPTGGSKGVRWPSLR